MAGFSSGCSLLRSLLSAKILFSKDPPRKKQKTATWHCQVSANERSVVKESSKEWSTREIWDLLATCRSAVTEERGIALQHSDINRLGLPQPPLNPRSVLLVGCMTSEREEIMQENVREKTSSPVAQYVYLWRTQGEKDA